MSEVKAAGSAPTVILAGGGTPALPAAPPATAAVPPLPHGAAAVNLAGALAQLPDGSRLSGVIVGQNAAGQPLLATDQGTFALDTTLALAPNTRLLLQIFTGQNGLSALVLLIDGKAQQPPPTIGLTPVDAAGPAAIPSAETGAALPAVLIDHARLTAVVLSNSPAAGDGTATARLIPGSTLVLRLIAASAGNSATTAATITADAAAAPASSPAPPAGAMAPPIPAGLAAELTAGLAGPAGSAGLRPAAAVGGEILGIVLGEASGRLQVQTPSGLLGIDMPADLPPGSLLSFEILGLAPPPAAALPPARSGGDPVLDFARGWPALRQTVDALRQIDPALAAAFVEQALPRPDAQLASSLLFFLAAVRRGDGRSWLGDDSAGPLDAADRGDLLDRLDADLAHIDQMAQNPSSSGWRALPVPLYDGQAITQIMLFTRHQQRPPAEGENGTRRDPASRFVVELELTATGPVQIDGLVQGESLDLIVRTQRALPERMQSDIRTLFHDGLAATRGRGSLHYQVTPHFPLAPLEEIAARRGGAALVV